MYEEKILKQYAKEAIFVKIKNSFLELEKAFMELKDRSKR